MNKTANVDGLMKTVWQCEDIQAKAFVFFVNHKIIGSICECKSVTVAY